MRSLPPLSAVRVFEAAARHENFTAAAVELSITQAAVSYQINLLEKRLGVLLFHRQGKRVALSDVGRRLAGKLSGAFSIMEAAFDVIRTDDAAVLTISTTVTFANAWFAWRLGSFQMANPNLGVRLHADDAPVDFARDEADLAVRFGSGEWPGLSSELLLKETCTPMCSPTFLAANGGRLDPADLLRLPQISPRDPLWLRWLRGAGVEVPEGLVRQGVNMDSQAHCGHAAIAGQGIALLTPFFWRSDMAEGRLVCPFPDEVDSGSGYWLVYPDHRRNLPKVRRFREWLLTEISNDKALLAARFDGMRPASSQLRDAHTAPTEVRSRRKTRQNQAGRAPKAAKT
jgi:LysR family transcriptional regulator, glycine cleavage system transcriptional activator